MAPLFDFTLNSGPNGWHTLYVVGEGQNPRREHLLKLAAQVDLRPRDAAEIISQVRGAVSGFFAVAKGLDLSKPLTERLQARFKEIDADSQ